MSATFATIKAGIVAKVSADTDLSGTGQVFDYEPPIQGIGVDPFAVVLTMGNESEFETSAENMRRFQFTVRVFVERNTAGESAAEALLTAIVDRLLQAFDEDPTLGVLGVLSTTAAPSEWSYVLSEKEYRVADIRLSTMASVLV